MRPLLLISLRLIVKVLVVPLCARVIPVVGRLRRLRVCRRLLLPWQVTRRLVRSVLVCRRLRRVVLLLCLFMLTLLTCRLLCPSTLVRSLVLPRPLRRLWACWVRILLRRR